MSVSKLPNQSYIMFKEQEQYAKSNRCVFLFRLVLFAEPFDMLLIANSFSYQQVLYGFDIECWYIKTLISING